MFTRKTLAPSWTNCRSVSGFSVAGPSVQIIFVLRVVSPLQLLRLHFPTWAERQDQNRADEARSLGCNTDRAEFARSIFSPCNWRRGTIVLEPSDGSRV